MRPFRLLFILPFLLAAGCGRTPEKKMVKEGMALAEEDRVYIAAIEARALVLNRRAFPGITAALASGEETWVGKFLSGDFSGTVPGGGKQETAPDRTAVVRRRSVGADGGNAEKLDAGKFTGVLTAMRRRFSAEATVEMALTSLSPVSNSNLDGAWTAGGGTAPGRRDERRENGGVAGEAGV